MTDRRSEPRFIDAELAMLSWQDGAAKLIQLVNVEDISMGGAGVIVDHAIEVGTEVTISYGEQELTGIVRHHSPRSDCYFVGIEFAESSKGSAVHFQPELLIRTL